MKRRIPYKSVTSDALRPLMKEWICASRLARLAGLSYMATRTVLLGMERRGEVRRRRQTLAEDGKFIPFQWKAIT